MAEKRVKVLEEKVVAREAALTTTEQRAKELRMHSSVLEQVVRQSSSKNRLLVGQSDKLQFQHRRVVAKQTAALEDKDREVAAGKAAEEKLSAKCVEVRYASRTPPPLQTPLTILCVHTILCCDNMQTPSVT